MRQYAVPTRDPDFTQVMNWVSANHLQYEIHLNRTRFFVPEDKLLTEFLLKFCHCCHEVDESLL